MKTRKTRLTVGFLWFSLVLTGLMAMMGWVYLRQQWLNNSLLDAVERSDVHRVQILLTQGASVNARERDTFDVADFVMLMRGEGRRRTKGNPTALMNACSHGDIAMVKTLLVAGADVNTRTAWGGDALHDAITDVEGNGREIIFLLANYGANLDPKTERGKVIWEFARYRPGMQDALKQAAALQKTKPRN